MMVVVAYDVSTETPEGRRRLRNVAKICMKYGQRVQNSVFECSVSPSDYLILKHDLAKIRVKGQNVCLARRVAGVRFGLFECRLSGCSRCR